MHPAIFRAARSLAEGEVALVTPSGRTEPPALASNWLSVPERGALWGIQSIFWMATMLGRTPARLFLLFLALYYVLVDRKVTEASRIWWRHVHQQSHVPWGLVFGHVRRFAHVTLDRIFLLTGRVRRFTFTRTGDHYLEALVQKRQGAILLGAHLGSYEAMRLGGVEDQVPINIIGNFSNAKMINALLERLNRNMAARVIHADPNDFAFIFKVQERIEAGEMVAILGDRVAEGQPSVEVEFFGEPARFPSGPFLIASLLKCPVYLTFGLYHEPNRYDLYCEPFSECITLPRRNREAALRAEAQRFAQRLEAFARRAPDNWFNFYNFWSKP